MPLRDFDAFYQETVERVETGVPTPSGAGAR